MSNTDSVGSRKAADSGMADVTHTDTKQRGLGALIACCDVPWNMTDGEGIWGQG